MRLGIKVFVQGDGIATARHILLDDYAACPLRHGRAGKDAHRLTGANRAVKAMSRRRLANHLEPRAGRGLVIAQGIAIHRRGGKGRLIAPRCHIARQNPTHGLGQRHLFRWQSGHKRKKGLKGLVNRDHCASYRPDLPPSFSMTRIPPISMDLSTALVMS